MNPVEAGESDIRASWHNETVTMEYLKIPGDIKGAIVWEGGFYTPENKLVKFKVYREMIRLITDHYPTITIPGNPGDKYLQLMGFDVVLGYVKNELKMIGLDSVDYETWRDELQGRRKTRGTTPFRKPVVPSSEGSAESALNPPSVRYSEPF